MKVESAISMSYDINIEAPTSNHLIDENIYRKMKNGHNKKEKIIEGLDAKCATSNCNWASGDS